MAVFKREPEVVYHERIISALEFEKIVVFINNIKFIFNLRSEHRLGRLESI